MSEPVDVERERERESHVQHVIQVKAVKVYIHCYRYCIGLFAITRVTKQHAIYSLEKTT